MNSLIGNKIKRIFAVGLLLLLSFSAVSQSLVGSWYEDSLHERSRFRNYFYRLNDTQLSVIDKKNNNAEVFFDYEIRGDRIIITSTGQSSPKISAGTFPITIKNENYFTIHFSTPLSFVRNSYAKEQAVDATKKAAIVAAAGYGAAVVGAVGGQAIAPVAEASSASANTDKNVVGEKAVVGAGAASPATATADKKVEKGKPIQNKIEGLRRENEVELELKAKYPEKKGYEIISEAYLRDKDGNIVKDPVTDTARRIDFVVVKDDKVSDSIEVTSKTADKIEQLAKEKRIRESGGNYVRNSNGILVEIPTNVQTKIERKE